MQIISTINSFAQLQGTSYYKKKQLHILSWKITGKLYKHFPGLSRIYKQNSRTFQDSKKNPRLSRTFPGCGNPDRNSSTPSTGYLFQKQTSTRSGFYTIYLAAKWLPRSDNQFDYFEENCPFLSTYQRRSTKMSCLSQITLDWQHFA